MVRLNAHLVHLSGDQCRGSNRDGDHSVVTPRGRNLDERAVMLEFGTHPAQILQAATLPAATLRGMSENLGTLEAGKLADLVLVDGELPDMSSLSSRVVRVYPGGRLVTTSTGRREQPSEGTWLQQRG
jgi:imidazolonepropionase-like amidohydrolase